LWTWLGARAVVDALHGQVPLELLFPADPDGAPMPRDPVPRRPASYRFETLSWTSDRPVSLFRLQAAIERLAPKLARAKGLFEAVEQPGRQLIFQFVGGRATLAPAGTPAPGLSRARIVFVAEIGALSSAEVGRMMDKCAHPGPD
jgi:G3E family GTPase